MHGVVVAYLPVHFVVVKSFHCADGVLAIAGAVYSVPADISWAEAAFTRGVQSYYTMDGKTTSFNA